MTDIVNLPSTYYNFDIVNATSTSILCEKTEIRTEPILRDATNTALSIAKFSLPASQIESFVIPDGSTDYSIGLGTTGISSSAVPEEYVVYDVVQPMFTQSQFPMYSYEDFIENMNRTCLLAYRNLLDELDNIGTNGSTTNVSVADTNASHDITLSITSGAGLATEYLGYIKIVLEFQSFTSGTAGYTGSDMLYDVMLIDPSGAQTCLIMSGQIAYDTTYVFEDGAINSQYSVDKSQPMQAGTYQPLEPLVKFSLAGINAIGNWKLRVKTRQKNSSHLLFEFKLRSILTMYKTDVQAVSSSQHETMVFAPSFAITSDKKLQISLDKNFVKSACWLTMSPKLFSLFSLRGVSVISGLSDDTPMYQIQIPQYYYNASSMSPVVFTEDIGSIYRLNDISNILIKSDTLPVHGEFTTQSRERIVMSLTVSSSDFNKAVYEFQNQQIKDREYVMINPNELRTINISVWVKYRSTGLTRQVYLPAYSSFEMLIKFFKINI